MEKDEVLCFSLFFSHHNYTLSSGGKCCGVGACLLAAGSNGDLGERKSDINSAVKDICKLDTVTTISSKTRKLRHYRNSLEISIFFFVTSFFHVV